MSEESEVLKKFTLEELSKFDGSEPDKPIYFGYKGKVYDVTKSSLFIDGMHFEHNSGEDLTDYMEESPHGDEVLHDCKIIGELVE